MRVTTLVLIMATPMLAAVLDSAATPIIPASLERREPAKPARGEEKCLHGPRCQGIEVYGDDRIECTQIEDGPRGGLRLVCTRGEES